MMVNRHNILEDDSGYTLATVEDTKPEDVALVIEALDGPAEYQWVRLRDGTLILGIFPQGDVYEELTQSKNVCPFEYIDPLGK